MSSQLDYAAKQVKTAKRQPNPLPWTIVVLAMALLPLYTCINIEVLNAQAGGILPRRPEPPNNQITKWRAMRLNEPRWREFSLRRVDPLTWETRPLTPAETADMNRQIALYNANSDLRDAVGTLGILQYPLVLVVLIGLAIRSICHDSLAWRIAISLTAAAVVACGYMMVYRSYLPSLGW